jgi:hypothetical protein
MKWLTLALLLTATPVEAHCFARWYYPWPQRCGVRHVALHKIIVAPPRNDFVANRNDFEIPLPSLARADLDGGAADEPTRARLLLRAALEATNAH